MNASIVTEVETSILEKFTPISEITTNQISR